MKAPKTIPNNNDHAGRIASDKVTFGPWHRYSVFAVHTRFDKVTWLVEDVEGIPEIIRQEDTFEQAVSGLI